MADYSEVRKILATSAQSQDEAIEKDRLERTITSVRTQRLAQNPIVGKYDFEHLSKIHKYLFEGLYDHAGELRPETEYWRKQSDDNTMLTEFAKASDCIAIIEETSNFIIDNNCFKDLDRENFLYEFAVSYAEFNYAHPFLEGNGRATRILFQQLAQEAGYIFDSQNIDKAEWDAACIMSCNHYILYEQEDGTKIGEEQEQNIYPLIDIMDKVLVKKDKELQIGQKWKHNELIDAGLNKKQADFVLKAQSKGFQIGSTKNGERLLKNQAKLLDLINTDNLNDKTMREFNASFDKGR